MSPPTVPSKRLQLKCACYAIHGYDNHDKIRCECECHGLICIHCAKTIKVKPRKDGLIKCPNCSWEWIPI